MSEVNQVFETLAGFRAAAGHVQKWLTLVGVFGSLACVVAAACDLVPAWTIPAAAGLVLAGVIWGFAWRRRVERAVWRGARVPVRGEAVRLPLEEESA